MGFTLKVEADGLGDELALGGQVKTALHAVEPADDIGLVAVLVAGLALCIGLLTLLRPANGPGGHGE